MRTFVTYPRRAMSRILIDMLGRRLEAAYSRDPFHALRRNIESVHPDEWDLKPADWSIEVFGTSPELSICDLALHVGGPKYMYANRAFGDALLEWSDIKLPGSREIDVVLAWMDGAHQALAEALAALTDDSELEVERPAPWNQMMTRERLVSIVTNHDIYHSGEINRQRALIRGAKGWQR